MIDSLPRNDDVHARISQRADLALVIVDEDCGVIFDTLQRAGFSRDSVLTESASGLTKDFEDVVRRLIRDGSAEPDDREACVAMISSRWFVRLQTLRATETLRAFGLRLFVLTIESLRNRDQLSDAVRRFSLTRREGEVLLLIMRGLNAAEIAEALYLAEGTVQGYYKRLLRKTNSRNRVAMVAAVLGWQAVTRANHSAQ
jgi:DNA-binding CsgD family transcriptional regulator